MDTKIDQRSKIYKISKSFLLVLSSASHSEKLARNVQRQKVESSLHVEALCSPFSPCPQLTAGHSATIVELLQGEGPSETPTLENKTNAHSNKHINYLQMQEQKERNDYVRVFYLNKEISCNQKQNFKFIQVKCQETKCNLCIGMTNGKR